jgi:hypothetical protein
MSAKQVEPMALAGQPRAILFKTGAGIFDIVAQCQTGVRETYVINLCPWV